MRCLWEMWVKVLQCLWEFLLCSISQHSSHRKTSRSMLNLMEPRICPASSVESFSRKFASNLDWPRKFPQHYPSNPTGAWTTFELIFITIPSRSSFATFRIVTRSFICESDWERTWRWVDLTSPSCADLKGVSIISDAQRTERLYVYVLRKELFLSGEIKQRLFHQL